MQGRSGKIFFGRSVKLEPLFEVPGISTKNSAQGSLNAIQLLELIGETISRKIIPRFRKRNNMEAKIKGFIKNNVEIKKMLLSPLLFLLITGCGNGAYEKGKLLFEDDFKSGHSNWLLETGVSEDAGVRIEDEKMVIDVDRGATVWLNKKLSGNISITYDRKVVMENGKNDRLSDLNQFWMARDPMKDSLFTREGVFKEYDSLQLYYFGIGGNRNTTTRFRKYTGSGEKNLIHDFQEEKYMLQPNKTYHVRTIVYNGVTKVFLDGEELFSYEDKEAYKEGYFGIRTTESRQEIDNVKIYQLK